MKNISGIQQVGIGIPSLPEAKAWYRDIMGMNAQVFEDAGTADLMTKYTGGAPGQRIAALTLNMQGGGGLEIWQYTSKVPVKPLTTPQYGDLGIYSVVFKCPHLKKAHDQIRKLYRGEVSDIIGGPENTASFWVMDPWGNRCKVMEDQSWFNLKDLPMGGVQGAVIGVSNMEKALALYKDVLGTTEIIYDQTGLFHDIPDHQVQRQEYRRVLLRSKGEAAGPFGRLLGLYQIELVQCLSRQPKRIFEGRHWGDAGFIHLCFDVIDMAALEKDLLMKGFPFTVDSGNTFDMGDSGGRFTYIEDPDGTLIEFVETHKVPIMKKLGWFLDLKKRDRSKPLPDWMVRMLGMSKIR